VVDIASLSFAIDSSQAVTSLDALTKLQDRAAALAQQKRELGRDAEAAGAAMGRSRSNATGLAASLAELTAANEQLLAGQRRSVDVFDQLNDRMTKAQRQLGSWIGETERFIRVNREAESIARVFGQATDGLVNYMAKASDLRLTADVTASSLDRITRALEGQTAAGAAVRAVMSQYGVDLDKYQMNQAGDAMRAFVDRTRGFRDSPARTRDIQTVMGPLDPDQLNNLLNPSYVSIAERESRDRSVAASADISRLMADVDARQRRRETAETRLADLRTRFETSGQGTQSAELAELERLAALPRDQQRQYMTRAAGEWRDWEESPVGRWGAFIGSGRWGANEAAIREQFDQASFERGGPLWSPYLGGGIAGRVYGAARSLPAAWLSQIQNAFGYYEPPEALPQRPEDPYAQSRRDLTLASRLAGYGEVGALGAATARFRMARMEQEGGRAAFQQLFGGDGDQRYDNLITLNETMARYAMRPEERVNDQTAQSRWMMSMMPGQRAFGAFVMRNAGALNIPTTRIENYADGADFLARGPMSDGQRLALRQGWEQEVQGRGVQRREDLDDQTQLQNRLREAISAGSGEVERARVGWTAYRAEMKATGDEIQALDAKQTALAELHQRMQTETEQATQTLRDQNDALKARNDLTSGLIGTDRLAAEREATVQAAALAADRARPGTGAGAATAEQQRQTLGEQSRAAGDAIVAQTREQLRLEVQILGVSGDRASTMERLRREQEIDQRTQQAMADAIASRDQSRIDALREQVRLTKDLREQMAVIQRLGEMTQQLRGIGDRGFSSAETSQFLMTLPREDRGVMRAVLPALELQGQGLGEATRSSSRRQYGEFPEELRQGIEAQMEGRGLPPEARQAFRGTIAMEAPRGQEAFRSPTQITPPAYEEVQRWRAQNNMPALPSLQDLRKPENWRLNVEAGLDYFEFLRARGRGDAGYAAAGYGPDGQVGLDTYLLTGSTRTLTRQQLERWMLAGGNPSSQDMARRYRPTPDGQRAIDGAVAAYDAGVQADNDRLWEQYGDRVGVRGAYLTAVRRGETGQAQIIQAGVYDPGDPTGRTRSMQAQQDVRFGFEAQFQERIGQAEREADFQRVLGDAYGESTAAVERVTIAYKAMQEQKRLNLSESQRELLQERLLTEARERTATQAKADTRRVRDEGDIYRADAETPWFAGPQTRAAARARVQADQYIRDKDLSGPVADAYRQGVEYRELQRAMAEDQQQLRTGFLQMGQAAQSAFADAILGGRGLRDIIGGLIQDWARLAAQMASRTAFNFVGDLIMKGANFLIGGSGFTPGVAQVPGAAIPMAQAAGGVVEQGRVVSMYAAGGRVGQDPEFSLAGRGTVLRQRTRFDVGERHAIEVAEAGRPEGIFPLVPTRSGDLGIQVAPGPGGTRQEPLPLVRLSNGDLAVRLPQDQPTTMMAAGGVVGGPERVGDNLPRPRPVAVSGAAAMPGGGGAGVNVTNNITFQGGAGGANGQVDQKTMRQLGEEVERTTRAAVMRVLADERRQGGMLYGER
jgi:hypothetical protein